MQDSMRTTDICLFLSLLRGQQIKNSEGVTTHNEKQNEEGSRISRQYVTNFQKMVMCKDW